MADQTGGRIDHLFPDGGPQLSAKGAAKSFATAVVLLVLIAGAISSAYTVQPEERALVKRWGKVVRQTEPGLHFKLPFRVERVQRVATERILKEEFGFRTIRAGQNTQYDSGDHSDESLMLTGDLNVIEVEWVVQYQISDPEKYLYRGLRTPEETLRDISEGVVRQIVGNRLGSDALTVGRSEIASSVQVSMQEILNTFNSGISIVRIELQDVTPPDRVKPSFNEVNESRQEREKMINQADRLRNMVIPRALGEARQVIAQAEGYSAERINRAKGEATRFLEMLAAYKDSPEVTRKRLYLEMMEEVVPNIGHLYIVEENQTSPIPLLNLNETGAALNLPGASKSIGGVKAK